MKKISLYTTGIILSFYFNSGWEDPFPVKKQTTTNEEGYSLADAMKAGNPKTTRAETLVTLTNVTTELCPTNLVRGDREFGGAPRVNITARLEISADRSGLIAVINFTATERRGDASIGTLVNGEFRPRVYTAPAGVSITGIKPANLSSAVVNFVGSDAGTEFGNCNEGMTAMSSPGGLIKRIVWVGDTGGNDVAAAGSDCRCDTKIKTVEFNKVRITTARR